MTKIKAFKALRPEAHLARQVASRPYDVLNSREAKQEAMGNPNSFLHITKSEIDLPESVDIHSAEVYEKAKQNLDAFISRNVLFRENDECIYIYRLVMNGRQQHGIVCLSSVEDYENGVIKKHEFTRAEKEKDRIDHMLSLKAQTGNVFLAYRTNPAVSTIINKWVTEKNPQYDFTAEDGVQHTIWVVKDAETIKNITEIFESEIPATYIADGHHRAASAAKVYQQLTGAEKENAAYFLTTLFASDELEILDYNRVVTDLNGESPESFLHKVSERFNITSASEAFRPSQPHEFGLYIQGQWFWLSAKEGSFDAGDVLQTLDVNILENNLLKPILNIHDQRTDKRIDFIGGIRGLKALEQRVDDGEAALAISLYPVSINQLFAIADNGQVMPPKSTWFEPKLRDGLLTHMFS